MPDYYNPETTGYNLIEFNYATTSGRFYHKTRPSTSAYVWERSQTVSGLGSFTAIGSGGKSSGQYAGYNKGGETGYADGTGIIWFISSTNTRNVTQYRSRSITTTYYYYRSLDKKSSSSVTSGGNISNVKKWVRYIPA